MLMCDRCGRGHGVQRVVCMAFPISIPGESAQPPTLVATIDLCPRCDKGLAHLVKEYKDADQEDEGRVGDQECPRILQFPGSGSGETPSHQGPARPEV